jgi:hypothetical protein
MKNFIRKISIILAISAIIIISLVYLLSNKERNNFLFVSTSISCNAKATHALQSPKFKTAQLLLVGSSMTLNNISAGLLEDSLKLITYNTASWGMKLGDFINIIQTDKEYIYMNISFIDFEKTWIEKKYGYPLDQNKFFIELNILGDFQTFKQQISDFNAYTNKQSKFDYTNLKFDDNGSVLFPKENFHIDSNRWNEKPKCFSNEDENRFIETLGKIIEKNKKATIIISFSPSREVFYDKNNSIKINVLFNRIKEKYNHIYCFNYYDLQYPDSFFVDNSHFNDHGAILYSQLMEKNIKHIIDTTHAN